jgi:hypothetical protein
MTCKSNIKPQIVYGKLPADKLGQVSYVPNDIPLPSSQG